MARCAPLISGDNKDMDQGSVLASQLVRDGVDIIVRDHARVDPRRYGRTDLLADEVVGLLAVGGLILACKAANSSQLGPHG